MKNALPPQGKLSKESKVCIQECVSEFISFVTSQAVDRCKLEKRKTLNGEDILWSLFTLGFENYSETLKIYLAKYREFEQQEAEKRPPRRRQRKKDLITQDSEDNYSEDISPENSEFQDLSRQITAEHYQLKNAIVNPQGPEIDFTFNDSNFSGLNIPQDPNNANNYIISRSNRYSEQGSNTSRNSQERERSDVVPNFDEFIERM